MFTFDLEAVVKKEELSSDENNENGVTEDSETSEHVFSYSEDLILLDKLAILDRMSSKDRHFISVKKSRNWRSKVKNRAQLRIFFSSKLKQLPIFLDKKEKQKQFEYFHNPQTTLPIKNLFNIFKFVEIHFVTN